MVKIGTPLAAAGFLLIAVAALAGVPHRGETKEASIAEACAHETWPAIAASCLTGAPQRAVRTVSVDRVGTNGMADRFAAAFE